MISCAVDFQGPALVPGPSFMHPTLYLLRTLSVLCLPSDLAHSEGKLEVSRSSTSRSSLSFGPPLRRVLHFPRAPWQDLVLWPIEVNCLLLPPSSSFCFIFPSLTGFPGISFHINHLHLNPCLSVYFWKNSKWDMQSSVHCVRHIMNDTSYWFQKTSRYVKRNRGAMFLKISLMALRATTLIFHSFSCCCFLNQYLNTCFVFKQQKHVQ